MITKNGFSMDYKLVEHLTPELKIRVIEKITAMIASYYLQKPDLYDAFNDVRTECNGDTKKALRIFLTMIMDSAVKRALAL